MFEESAEDGSEINKVIVPVIHGPRIVENYIGFRIHVVKPGDTLSKISEEHYGRTIHFQPDGALAHGRHAATQRVIWSNPIAEAVLTELSLSESERGTIQRAMEKLVRERAGGSGSARLSNPINVGIGIK